MRPSKVSEPESSLRSTSKAISLCLGSTRKKRPRQEPVEMSSRSPDRYFVPPREKLIGD
jgi:hypothetical protein